jgi:hypothetical protein
MVRRAEEIGLNRSADFAAACPRSKERQGDRQQSAPWPGTEGSNPPPSSSESIANLISVIGSFTADLSCSHFAVMADKDVELYFFARP